MGPDLFAALSRLTAQFPSESSDSISTLLCDSVRVVAKATGEPLVGKAEELARLRLETRTGAPALLLAEGVGS
jgi:hypothetical protein